MKASLLSTCLIESDSWFHGSTTLTANEYLFSYVVDPDRICIDFVALEVSFEAWRFLLSLDILCGLAMDK